MPPLKASRPQSGQLDGMDFDLCISACSRRTGARLSRTSTRSSTIHRRTRATTSQVRYNARPSLCFSPCVGHLAPRPPPHPLPLPAPSREPRFARSPSFSGLYSKPPAPASSAAATNGSGGGYLNYATGSGASSAGSGSGGASYGSLDSGGSGNGGGAAHSTPGSQSPTSAYAAYAAGYNCSTGFSASSQGFSPQQVRQPSPR